MYKDLLPIGSVVNVDDGDGGISLMICSRIVAASDEDVIYDYGAVPYPQGFIDTDNIYMFNRDAIENVLFIGCQNEVETAFREQVLDKLGELKIVNGEIVEG